MNINMLINEISQQFTHHPSIFLFAIYLYIFTDTSVYQQSDIDKSDLLIARGSTCRPDEQSRLHK